MVTHGLTGNQTWITNCTTLGLQFSQFITFRFVTCCFQKGSLLHSSFACQRFSRLHSRMDAFRHTKLKSLGAGTTKKSFQQQKALQLSTELVRPTVEWQLRQKRFDCALHIFLAKGRAMRPWTAWLSPLSSVSVTAGSRQLWIPASRILTCVDAVDASSTWYLVCRLPSCEHIQHRLLWGYQE